MENNTIEMNETELRAMRDCIDKALAAGSGELSDEQLDGVSGGLTATFRAGASTFVISSNGKTYSVCRFDDSAPTNGHCINGQAKK